MDRDDLTAVLEWMQAMQDCWRATNSAVMSLAQSMGHYQVARRLPIETQRPAHIVAEVEQQLRKKLEALELQSSPEPLPLRAKTGLG